MIEGGSLILAAIRTRGGSATYEEICRSCSWPEVTLADYGQLTQQGLIVYRIESRTYELTRIGTEEAERQATERSP